MAMRSTGPAAAQVLGLVAAAPFVVLAGLFCWGPMDLRHFSSTALPVYAAAMVSFMGGSRWGMEAGRAAPRWLVLGPGMAAPLLALLAWVGTAELALSWRFGAYIVLFLALWLWDTILSELPAWYLRLRTVAQTIASVSLAFGLEKTLRL